MVSCLTAVVERKHMLMLVSGHGQWWAVRDRIVTARAAFPCRQKVR